MAKTFEEFCAQVTEGWHGRTPAHRILRYHHPLGDIVRLQHLNTPEERATLVRAMYETYVARERMMEVREERLP